MCMLLCTLTVKELTSLRLPFHQICEFGEKCFRLHENTICENGNFDPFDRILENLEALQLCTTFVLMDLIIATLEI